MATQPAAIANYRPTVLNRYLHVTQLGYKGVTRFSSRTWAGIRAIVVHVQEGSNWGSWQHFHTVTASSTVLIGKNGDIWNLVPEDKAPWTNGDVAKPDHEAIALMNRYGWDPNRYSLTIENEGFTGNLPYTQDQFLSNVWQIWQWLQKYPTIEEVHIMRHGQINSVSRYYCPEGPPYTFMGRIEAALAGAMIPETPNAPTEVFRTPWPVKDNDGKLWDGSADLTVTNDQGKQTTFHADKRSAVEVVVDVLSVRQWASSLSNLVRIGLTLGQTFAVLGWVEGEEVDGERRWWVTPTGARIWSGGTREKPKAPAPIPEKPDDGVSQPDWGNNVDAVPVILNGNAYYPLEQHGEQPGQTVRFKTNTNVRLWAATHEWSPVTRVAAEGSTSRATHYVRGEEVDIPGYTTDENRDRWLVLAEGKDPITSGGRVWSGLVEVVE